MPSPIAHSAVGYAIYTVFQSRRPAARNRYVGPIPSLLIVTVGLSLLPDLDSVFGLATDNFGRYHNNLTHSLVVGVGVAAAVGALATFSRRFRFADGFLIALMCYDLHVIMDFFTFGRGVMALWPLSSERFLSPITLFYGLHWSDGVFSARHLVTIVTEVAFTLLVALMMGVRASAHGVARAFAREQGKSASEGT